MLKTPENILERKRFGKTDLFITSICWGCAPLGNIPKDFGYEVSEDRAIEILLEAFGSQINFFDTASSYGESESRIGRAIKRMGGLPKGCVIATKADRNLETNDFSSSQIRESAEKSIERLGFKPLQLVYLHDPEYHPKYKSDEKQAFEEIMAPDGPVAELEKLKREGLILNIGISGGPIEMLRKFISSGRFDAVITHNRWNLLWQTADPLIEDARRMNLGIVNAGVYASGILATGANENTRAAYRVPSPEIIDRVKNMETICRKYNIPLAAAALQFSLRDSRITSTAVGISEPQQSEETLRLASLPMPDALWEELKPFAIREGYPERGRQ